MKISVRYYRLSNMTIANLNGCVENDGKGVVKTSGCSTDTASEMVA